MGHNGPVNGLLYLFYIAKVVFRMTLNCIEWYDLQAVFQGTKFTAMFVV
jgi:hypothetical protein